MTPEQAARRYQRHDKPAQRRRRKAGLCVSCHAPVDEINPSTGQRYWRCAAHRKMASAASGRYARPMRAAWRSAGLCRDCGQEPGRNRRTGQVYVRCMACRMAGAEHQVRQRAARKQERRDAAIAQWEQSREQRSSTFR